MNYITAKTRDKAHVKITNHKRWDARLETYRSHILNCASAKEVFLKVFSPEAVDKLEKLRIVHNDFLTL